MEEKSYTSTHPLGHNTTCNRDTLPFFYIDWTDVYTECYG